MSKKRGSFLQRVFDMQNAETNFVKIIREVCREEEIELRSYSADWIFRLDKNGRHDVILGYQFGLNSASVNMLCQDKCAASELMTEFGIPNIEHVLFASPENQKFMGFPGFWRDLLKMLDRYKTVVCKPNLGTGGENVIKCSTDYELEAAVHRIFLKSDYMAVSRYYEIENEYRAVILDGEIRLVYRKRRPQIFGDGVHTVAGLMLRYKDCGNEEGTDREIHGYADLETDLSQKELSRVPAEGERVILNWRHNLGQGARADLLENGPLKDQISEIVRRVYEEIGVRFASVDIVETEEGLKVLEINSGVMMENFAGQDAHSYETAKAIYRDAIRKMMSEVRI